MNFTFTYQPTTEGLQQMNATAIKILIHSLHELSQVYDAVPIQKNLLTMKQILKMVTSMINMDEKAFKDKAPVKEEPVNAPAN